jgi:hypothetical protein
VERVGRSAGFADRDSNRVIDNRDEGVVSRSRVGLAGSSIGISYRSKISIAFTIRWLEPDLREGDTYRVT